MIKTLQISLDRLDTTVIDNRFSFEMFDLCKQQYFFQKLDEFCLKFLNFSHISVQIVESFHYYPYLIISSHIFINQFKEIVDENFPACSFSKRHQIEEPILYESIYIFLIHKCSEVSLQTIQFMIHQAFGFRFWKMLVVCSKPHECLHGRF